MKQGKASVHTTKTYRERRGIDPVILSLGITRKRAVSFIPRPPGTQPSVSTHSEGGGGPRDGKKVLGRGGGGGKNKTFWTCPDSSSVPAHTCVYVWTKSVHRKNTVLGHEVVRASNRGNSQASFPYVQVQNSRQDRPSVSVHMHASTHVVA